MDRRPLARPHRGHARVHETDARPIGEGCLTSRTVPRPGLSVRRRDGAGIFVSTPFRSCIMDQWGVLLEALFTHIPAPDSVSLCSARMLSTHLPARALSATYNRERYGPASAGHGGRRTRDHGEELRAYGGSSSSAQPSSEGTRL